ncbi:MAG: ISL3 family transposase [Gemmatimonadota bacterium]|nr:ISL3 family transposase [Gemmatimonadota bacterium]
MTLLPNSPGLKLEDIFIEAEAVSLRIASTHPTAACPACGRESGRLHSHYERAVSDLPWAGRVVGMCLRVRRFRCANRGCARRIFAERLPSVVEPYARKTVRLREVLLLVGLALGGEAGTRLAERLGMEVSPSTLLRSLHSAALPVFEPPEVIGVDDFALLKGRRYGTIVVDFERNRPIGLLEDRSAETLAAWLEKYPKLRIIGRDRSTEYERGIEEGAPQAVEVLDRWHLLKNLRRSTERVLEGNSAALSGITLPAKSGSGEEVALMEHTPAPRSSKEQAASAASRKNLLARYQKVKKLHGQGMSMLAICRALGMSRGAVRRYVHADSFPERPRHPPQESMLDPFKPYLAKRWEEGSHVAMQLWREIKEQGYPGAPGRVLQWARQRRREPAPTTPGRYVDSMRKKTSKNSKSSPRKASRPLSSRRLAWIMVGEAEHLSSEERHALQRAIEACADVAAIHPLVQKFSNMVRSREAGGLEEWLGRSLSCGVKGFETFAMGLKREQPAVEAALTLPYSNGQTEGQVNRLKTIKRQMYGRASFGLLRRRFLGLA